MSCNRSTKKARSEYFISTLSRIYSCSVFELSRMGATHKCVEEMIKEGVISEKKDEKCFYASSLSDCINFLIFDGDPNSENLKYYEVRKDFAFFDSKRKEYVQVGEDVENYARKYAAFNSPAIHMLKYLNRNGVRFDKNLTDEILVYLMMNE